MGRLKFLRLTPKVKKRIIEYAKQHFGDDSKLYLFGSRIYDDKKGGDIDLFLESMHDIDMQIQVNFLRDIYKNVTERKVDLIIKTPFTQDKPILHTAKKEGILLC